MNQHPWGAPFGTGCVVFIFSCLLWQRLLSGIREQTHTVAFTCFFFLCIQLAPAVKRCKGQMYKCCCLVWCKLFIPDLQESFGKTCGAEGNQSKKNRATCARSYHLGSMQWVWRHLFSAALPHCVAQTVAHHMSHLVFFSRMWLFGPTMNQAVFPRNTPSSSTTSRAWSEKQCSRISHLPSFSLLPHFKCFQTWLL